MRISADKSIFLGRTTTYNNKEDDKKYETVYYFFQNICLPF